MKNTMRKAMLSTIAMLVVAVMSLTGVTYAWFSAATTADVTGMTMNVAAAEGGFQVSTSQTGPWSSTVDFNAAMEEGKKNESPELIPVSTVDGVNFFKAEVLSETATDNVSIKTLGLAEGDNAYWENTFYARNTSEEKVTVYLSTKNIFKDSNPDDVKKAYEAARIAVFVGDSSTPAYIWGAGESNLGINAADKTIANCYASSAEGLGTVTALKTNLADCYFELPATVDGEPQVTKIVIRAWIEGQDVQCVNKNASDIFDIDIDLSITAPTEG